VCAAAAGLPAREGEDLTFDKSDPKDAVLIARLAAGLHCYDPERANAVWSRLRHLGASGAPFRLASWRAALAVTLDRCASDLARVRGPARPGEAAVRRELLR
jgi:transposase